MKVATKILASTPSWNLWSVERDRALETETEIETETETAVSDELLRSGTWWYREGGDEARGVHGRADAAAAVVERCFSGRSHLVCHVAARRRHRVARIHRLLHRPACHAPTNTIRLSQTTAISVPVSLYVCLYACLCSRAYLRNHTPNFTKFYMRVACVNKRRCHLLTKTNPDSVQYKRPSCSEFRLLNICIQFLVLYAAVALYLQHYVIKFEGIHILIKAWESVGWSN